MKAKRKETVSEYLFRSLVQEHVASPNPHQLEAFLEPLSQSQRALFMKTYDEEAALVNEQKELASKATAKTIAKVIAYVRSNPLPEAFANEEMELVANALQAKFLRGVRQHRTKIAKGSRKERT